MPLPTVKPPDDSAFDGKDFLPAPDIEAVAEMLRERHNLPVEPTFRFLWKARGGKKGGAPKRGWCQKLSGPAKHFSGGAEFLIWLAADALREAKFSQSQLTALVYHELLFVGVDYDDDGNPTSVMRGVDFEGFVDEVREYGAWEDNLKVFADAVKQAPLFSGEGAMP